MRPKDLWRGLGTGRGRGAARRDVEAELEAHLAHRVDDLVADGLDPAAARARAEAEFGDVDHIREACLRRREGRLRRDRRAGAWEAARRDVAHAFRQLRRNPGFAAVVILTLTVGIGATTTIASVVHAVVLAPLPFEDPDRLVIVKEVTPAGEDFSVSHPTFLDWRREAASFASMGAFTGWSFTLTGRGEPRSVFAYGASATLLPTLGVEPLLGRGILAEEDVAGEPAAVVVLGHSLWQSAFGADRGVLGTDVVLGGRAHRVVGVLPPGLSFLGDADLLVPLGASPASSRDDADLDVMARLAPGASVAAARAEMEALADRLGELHPVDLGWGARVTPLRDALVGEAVRRAGWVLVGAAALLLLIACVNVSNVLMARASTRRSEMGVRAALGAGRGRMVRMLLTESAVLAAVGGALGLALTRLALPAVKALGAGRVPRLDQAEVSPLVMATCGAAILLATTIFGMAPALELGRSPAPRGERGGTGSGGRLRSGLVAGQIALSLALLLGTGLLVRSFARLAAVDPGFASEGRLTTRLALTGSYSPDERRALMREVLDAVEALPEVERAGATAVHPFSGYNLANFAAREDRMPADARDFLPIAWRVVTPGLVETLGMRVLAGRTFEPGSPGEGEVLITETLARALWPEGGAVGSTLVWGDPSGSHLTVVGVVADLRDRELQADPSPMILRSYEEIPWAVMTVVARVRGRPESAAGGMRAAIRAAVPGLAVPEIEPLAGRLRSAVAGPRFNAVLLGTFAATGLLLALIGVYGVTSFGVSRRRREIGIRLALGGDPGGIRRMVVRHSVGIGLAGVAAGVVLGAAVAQGLSGLLFQTGAGDPLIWIVAPTALLLATVAAAWIPARRATRVAPREVLGSE
ncbi:MAG: ABC transporter permease [Gemmatimonadetes bacterium]|nr:ABC transporter permease [Gemmatimonadota bacterium]